MNEELDWTPVYWRIAEGSIMPFSQKNCPMHDWRPHSATQQICLQCAAIYPTMEVRSIKTGVESLTPEQLAELTK